MSPSPAVTSPTRGAYISCVALSQYPRRSPVLLQIPVGGWVIIPYWHGRQGIEPATNGFGDRPVTLTYAHI